MQVVSWAYLSACHLELNVGVTELVPHEGVGLALVLMLLSLFIVDEPSGGVSGDLWQQVVRRLLLQPLPGRCLQRH